MLNLEQNILSQLPKLIFWKDSELIYQGCNENFSKFSKLSQTCDIIGRSDFEMSWREEQANLYQSEDRYILENESETVDRPVPITITNETFYLRGSKRPWIKENRLSGIIGLYEIIDKPAAAKMFAQQFNIEELKKISSKDFGLYTRREVETIIYLLRGNKARTIADILDLSFRTIEYYIENIKNKLSCRTYTQMLNCIINSNFIDTFLNRACTSRITNLRQFSIRGG